MFPWFSPQVQQPVQQPVPYHGLINHGSTCYLNSVLQVLFMTKEFREAVNRFVEENPDTQSIDRHLKDLFDDLLRRKAYTYKIIKALGIDRVYEQQDAAEYFERILRQTSPNTAKIFHGQMAHRTTCSVCDTKSDIDGPFWHLPLELVDSSSGNYSVEDGINTYFRPTYLGDDNQMYCDTCDTKVNATSSYVITHHPDVLILLLKRFDFSYRYMSYVKINCAVDVPYTLTVPKDQTYELYGVVDHSGDLRSGHYIAKIKSQEDDEETWYSFDDTRVAALASSPFQDNVNVTQFQSAYLLFYKKKDTQEKCEKTTNEENVTESSSEMASITKEGNGTETQNKAKKRPLEKITEKKELADKNKKKKMVKDPDKSDVPVTDQVTPGEGENETENSNSHTQKEMMKDEDTGGQGEDRTLPSSGDQNQPTDSEDSNADANQNFTLGQRETSVVPAEATESEEKRTNCEQFVESGENGSQDKMKALKRKSMDKKSEENQGEKKGKHGIDQSEIKESEHNQQPETEDMRTHVKSVEREKSTFPPVHYRHDETSDGQSSLDKKTEDKRKKQETDNCDSHLQDRTSQNENTNDQEENDNKSSTGDGSEVKDPETSDQHEVDQMRHESTPVDSEESPSPAGHDRLDERRDVTDENKQTKREVRHETENLAPHSQDLMDHKVNRNLLSDEDQSEVSHPMKAALPETKEMKQDRKQEKTETENSDKLSENNLSKDKNTDDLKENSDLVSNEDQTEVLKESNETGFENMGENLKQEGNRNLPSTGDQNEVNDSEKSDLPEADKTTPDGKQEFENLPVTASNNELDELNDALKKLTIETTERTEKEEKHKTGISNFNSQNKTVKDSDSNQDGLEHTEPAINQPGDFERTVEPAALHSGDEGSGVQELTDGKKDENKQMETSLKHQTEYSVRQTEDMRVMDEDQIKSCDILSDGDLNKVKDSDNDTLTETKQTEAANHDFKTEDGETSAGHERQEDMDHTQGDLTDEMTEENKSQESENPPLPAQDTTVKDANSNDSKREENLPSSGNHYELKDQTLTMKHDTKPVEGEPLPTGNDRRGEKSDASRIEIDLTAEDKKQKEEEEQNDARTSNSQSQDVMMKDEDNDNQEENKNLISTDDENKARMRAAVHQDFTPVSRELLVVTAGHKSQDERSDAQDTFTNKMTEESKLTNKETENLAANSQDLERLIDNDHQGDRSLLSDGDQNKGSDPMKTGLPETKDIKPDVKQKKTETENSDRQRENKLSKDKNTDDLKSDSDQVSNENQTDVLKKDNKTQVENTRANMNQEENRNLSSTGEQGEGKDPKKSDVPEADQRTPDVKQGCIFVVHEKSPETASNNRLDELNDTQKKLINESTEENKQTEEEVRHETENSDFSSQNITVKDSNINQEEGRNLLLTGDLNDAERSDVPESNQVTPDIERASKHLDTEMSPLPAGHDTQDQLSDVHSTVMGLTAEENEQTEGKTVKDEDPFNQEENQKLLSTGDQNKDKHPENKEPTVFEEKRTDSEQLHDTQDKVSILKSKSDKQENQEEKKVKQVTENKVNNTDADEQEQNINLSSTGDEREVNDPETSNQPDMNHEPPSPAGHDRLDERSDAQRRKKDVTDENEQTENSLDVPSQENNTEQHQNRNLHEDQNKEKDSRNKEPTEFKNKRPNMNHDVKPGDGETSEHDREEKIQTQDDQNDEVAGSHSQEMTLEEDDEEKRNLLPAEDQNEAKDPESEEVVEFVEMSPDVSHGSKPLGSNRSAVPAVHYQKYTTVGKDKLLDVNTKENKHKQEVTVMVDDQEESVNLLSTENKAEVTDPETAAPPEAEAKHNTRKCILLIGHVTLFLFLFILAALFIYFFLL